MTARALFSLKDLEAADARLALGAARFVEKELGADIRGRRLVVALSGGADSTALLTVFCALRGMLGVSLFAAHLDHGLRAESAAEAQAAGELCRRFGVPFFVKRADVGALAQAQRCGVEEAGRRARYEFLEECRAATGSRWVLTAHHVGDLAEDVLMRLSRGALWPGLGGMKGLVDEPGRHVLRPLLMLEKAQLEGLLRRVAVTWQEDASNRSRAWKRNRMRHDVLPLLLAENPSFYESVRRLWRAARRDERDWANTGALALEDRGGGVLLSDASLAALGESGRLRAMAEALRKLGGEARADTLESLEAAWRRRHFPRRFSFGGGVKAELSGTGVWFHHAPGR